MGGKKKPTISQLAKRMEREKERKEREKLAARVMESEGRRRLSWVTDDVIRKIIDEVRNVKVITPYELASKYELKISTAKKILRMLANQGLLELVDKSRRVEIYVPKTAAAS